MEHRNQTDQVKKIQLPSSLERVAWTKRMASAGSLVGLEILTHFVGNRSEIEIEMSDYSGKILGKYKEKISGNRFWAEIKVPADAKQALYANVKLPKHSLQMKSAPLIILPLVEISNLKWGQKEAREGDIVSLSADVKGVPDGTEGEIEIWEYDSDSAHDFITKFPVYVKNNKIEATWEYEYHEDRDEIPTQEELDKYGNKYNPPEYFFRVKTGEVHAGSGLLEFKDWIEIELMDENDDPIPSQDYKVTLPNGYTKNGKLDQNGYALIKDIPPGRVEIEFPYLNER